MQFSQVRPFLVHYTQGSPRVNTIAMISGLFYGLSHENLLEFFFQKCILIFPGNWLGWICGHADIAVETNCHAYTTLDDLDPAIV